MSTALWILLIAIILPIVCAGIGKANGSSRYDNRNPREWFAQQQGRAARANAAQANSWEALAMYTAGLVAAFMGGLESSSVALYAVVFLVARIVYIYCYVSDRATPRSLAWSVGFFACVALIVRGALSIA
jgi:uncharacterized MAPEG superfamily protein